MSPMGGGLTVRASKFSVGNTEALGRRILCACIGIGLSVYVEVTNPIAGPEFGAIEIKNLRVKE